MHAVVWPATRMLFHRLLHALAKSLTLLYSPRPLSSTIIEPSFILTGSRLASSSRELSCALKQFEPCQLVWPLTY